MKRLALRFARWFFVTLGGHGCEICGTPLAEGDKCPECAALEKELGPVLDAAMEQSAAEWSAYQEFRKSRSA